MKLKKGENDFVTVTWSDHAPGCVKCRDVSLDTPPQFVNACPLGSQLIGEEMIKRQAPVVREKAAAVRKWVETTGVFKIK